VRFILFHQAHSHAGLADLLRALHAFPYLILLSFARRAVERLLQFVANLASFSNDKYNSDSELAVDLLEKIIPLTKSKDKAVRFRSCQLTSKLLNRYLLLALQSLTCNLSPPSPGVHPHPILQPTPCEHRHRQLNSVCRAQPGRGRRGQ